MKLSPHKNIIITDFPATTQWQFLKSLEKFTGKHFELKCIDATVGVSKIRRLVSYFCFPVSTFLHRNNYDIIISWQQFFGIMIAFYSRLLKVKKGPKIIVMSFIYKSKKGLVGRLYKKWIKYSVNNCYIDRLVVYSKHEIDFYCQQLGIEREKIIFVPLGIPVTHETHDDENLKAQNYIFSPGKSNRDFEFLVNSLKGENYNLHIACNTFPLVSEPNISVHHNVFDDKMIHYMHNCRCVVIPLKDLDVSSGQLVILQAMQLKKPIIVTNSPAVAEYVTHGVNGLLINNNKQELLAALNTIYNHHEFAQKLALQGYNTFLAKHTEKAMGKNLANIVAARMGDGEDGGRRGYLSNKEKPNKNKDNNYYFVFNC